MMCVLLWGFLAPTAAPRSLESANGQFWFVWIQQLLVLLKVLMMFLWCVVAPAAPQSLEMFDDCFCCGVFLQQLLDLLKVLMMFLVFWLQQLLNLLTVLMMFVDCVVMVCCGSSSSSISWNV